MALVDARLFSRIRQMMPELVKFGIIGGIGAVVDLGGAAVLHSGYHMGPLVSKAISVTAATVFTYLGSRFWTFKDRENQTVGREAVLFIVLNVIGLLIAEAVLGLATYTMNLRGQLEYNAASLLGTGLGTIFRFYAYRKWVFLAPAERHAPATAPQSAAPAVPDYAPWELDRRFLTPDTIPPSWQASAARSSWTPAAEYDPPWHGNQDIPNERVVPSPVLAASANRAGHDAERPSPPRPLAPRPGQRPAGRHRRH